MTSLTLITFVWLGYSFWSVIKASLKVFSRKISILLEVSFSIQSPNCQPDIYGWAPLTRVLGSCCVWPLCFYFLRMYTNIHTVSYNVFLTDCIHTVICLYSTAAVSTLGKHPMWAQVMSNPLGLVSKSGGNQKNRPWLPTFSVRSSDLIWSVIRPTWEMKTFLEMLFKLGAFLNFCLAFFVWST